MSSSVSLTTEAKTLGLRDESDHSDTGESASHLTKASEKSSNTQTTGQSETTETSNQAVRDPDSPPPDLFVDEECWDLDDDHVAVAYRATQANSAEEPSLSRRPTSTPYHVKVYLLTKAAGIPALLDDFGVTFAVCASGPVNC